MELLGKSIKKDNFLKFPFQKSKFLRGWGKPVGMLYWINKKNDGDSHDLMEDLSIQS